MKRILILVFAVSMLLCMVSTYRTLGSETVPVPDRKDAGAKYKKPTAPQFVRLLEKDGKPLALQVSVVTYKPVDGSDLEVKLISMVHIGDRTYYAAVNKLMTDDMIVLYEGVGDPKNARADKGGKKDLFSSLLDYSLQARLIGLSTQAAGINYKRPNFRHSDVRGLLEGNRAQGGNDIAMMGRLMLDGLDLLKSDGGLQGNEAPPEDHRLLKIHLAKQLSKVTSFEKYPALNKVLVQDRNKACLKQLDAQIELGHKKFGVLWGAAHNEDFHQQLCGKFGLMPTGEPQWLTAWDLTTPAPNPEDVLEEVLQEALQDAVQDLLRELLAPKNRR